MMPVNDNDYIRYCLLGEHMLKKKDPVNVIVYKILSLDWLKMIHE